MKSQIKALFGTLLLIAVVGAMPALADDAMTGRFDRAADTLRAVASAQGNDRLMAALSDSLCVGVIPGLTQAALIAGGQHGHGLVTCRLPGNEWSAPAAFTVRGGSVGAQAGIQQKSLVILAMGELGKRWFTQGEFNRAGRAEATAEAAAGSRAAAQSWGDQPIMTFQLSKGLFAGVNLTDVVVHPDKDVMTSLYGEEVKAEDVLDGQVPVPDVAQPFLTAVRQLEGR